MINNRKRPITVLKTLNANIFTRIFYKINFSNKKDNQLLLDIDLLKEETKKDLLYISSQNLEKLYSGLFEQPNPSYYMQVNGEALFLNLVKVTCEEFLAKQYGCCLKINTKRLERSLYTKHLLKDLNVLFQVPFYALLDPQAAQFKKIYYPIYTYVSESFLEALIDNLIIEIANCIIIFFCCKFFFFICFPANFISGKIFIIEKF